MNNPKDTDKEMGVMQENMLLIHKKMHKIMEKNILMMQDSMHKMQGMMGDDEKGGKMDGGMKDM